MRESQHALTPLPALLPSFTPWPREGRAEGGRARSVCASEVAPLMMPCPSCPWRCLHPFLGLKLQLLYLVKALCAACPACSPQQQTCLSWHTQELSGATRRDKRFSPIYGVNLIILIHRIDSGQVTRGATETSESAGHHFGMLYPETFIALYSAIGQRRPLFMYHHFITHP